jgi:hypothetical protein
MPACCINIRLIYTYKYTIYEIPGLNDLAPVKREHPAKEADRPRHNALKCTRKKIENIIKGTVR